MQAIYAASLNDVIGCIFKRLRTERNIDQETVAKSLGVSVSTISKIELGNVSITVESIYMLCELYGIEMLGFFENLNKARDFLKSARVKIYVEKSVEVKSVDKRVVRYELNQKNELEKNLALVTSTVTSTLATRVASKLASTVVGPAAGAAVSAVASGSAPIAIGAAISALALSLSKNNEKKQIEKIVEVPVVKNEKQIHNADDYVDLPIIYIKQLYIILEEFFESNPIPLAPDIQKVLAEVGCDLSEYKSDLISD